MNYRSVVIKDITFKSEFNGCEVFCDFGKRQLLVPIKVYFSVILLRKCLRKILYMVKGQIT